MTAPALDFLVTEPGVYDGIPNDRYHADPVAAGSLSFSGAKLLLPPSCPALFRWAQDHPVHKDVFDWGSAAHKLVLADSSVEIVVVDADDWRTKAAREQRDEARLAGLVPMLRDAYQQVLAKAIAIKDHPLASKLFEPGSGKAEQSLFWQDPVTGVWRRCRLDWLPNPRGGRLVIPDYKTAVSADPETWAKAAANYAYNQQAAWYSDGVRALDLDEEPAFVFVVQEKNPPYVVTVIELDEVAVHIGRMLNQQALQVYAECRRDDRWPDFSNGVVLQPLPTWYTRRWDED